MKLSAISRLLAVKLPRLIWEEPMKAMPLVLTRMTFAFCPTAWVMMPAITLGSWSQTRLSVVKFAPCTRFSVARLSTCWNCTEWPGLTLKLCQLRMALSPTWLTMAWWSWAW